jgi:hypothetical protein
MHVDMSANPLLSSTWKKNESTGFYTLEQLDKLWAKSTCLLREGY